MVGKNIERRKVKGRRRGGNKSGFTVTKDERRDEGEPCDYYNFTVINSFFVYFSLL